MKYFISKNNYNGEVIYLNCKKIKGYKVNPKNNVPYEGIKVNEMVIIKPSMIEKILKRKIKSKLENYLRLVVDLDDIDEDDSRIALDELQRYKSLINDKYSPFLDDKYINLLLKKINVIERELKQHIVFSSIIESEEKETRRSR